MLICLLSLTANNSEPVYIELTADGGLSKDGYFITQWLLEGLCDYCNMLRSFTDNSAPVPYGVAGKQVLQKYCQGVE